MFIFENDIGYVVFLIIRLVNNLNVVFLGLLDVFILEELVEK